MINNIFLGIGSNKGNKIEYLASAVQKLNSDEFCKVEKVSSIYESEPYGVKEQDTFFNAVVQLRSERNLFELHSLIKKFEKEIGRIESSKWGPREIDIDLLFFGNEIYSDEKLTVPHKEILLRDFVIIPLKEIAPEFIHPKAQIKIKEIDLNKIEKLIFKKIEIDLKNFLGEKN